MRKSLPFWIVVGLSVLALVASALLFVDYVRPAPVFCGLDGGCGEMKKTIFAHPFGVPMPVYGLTGFFAIALLGFLPGKRFRIAQAMFAVFGAIVAAGLLVVQGILHTICPYCAIVDVSAIVLAVFAVMRAMKGWDPPTEKLPLGIGVGITALAIAVPITIGFVKKPLVDIPAVITAEIQRTPKGKVTVVDFVDFECPFCRATHARLAPLLESHKNDVRVVRKNVPLRMHRHAMDAARTACCADEMGKGDEMAEALMSTPPTELTPEGCEKLAKERGLDVESFRMCVKSPHTEERIKAESDTFHAAHGHGLPTLWFNTIVLEGEQDDATLKATLDTALKSL